jgi:very-short-patch-repair endonuclease
MSALEETLVLHIRAVGLPAPEREFYFAKPRRWRFDLCWPGRKVAAEIEGGTWVQGRHSRGSGMRKDAEKYNAAALDGWRVLRFTADMIRDGSAISTLERAIQ